MKPDTNKQIADLKQQIKELREDVSLHMEMNARATQKITDLTDIVIAMFKFLQRQPKKCNKYE